MEDNFTTRTGDTEVSVSFISSAQRSHTTQGYESGAPQAQRRVGTYSYLNKEPCLLPLCPKGWVNNFYQKHTMAKRQETKDRDKNLTFKVRQTIKKIQ